MSAHFCLRVRLREIVERGGLGAMAAHYTICDRSAKLLLTYRLMKYFASPEQEACRAAKKTIEDATLYERFDSFAFG